MICLVILTILTCKLDMFNGWISALIILGYIIAFIDYSLKLIDKK